MSLLKRNVIAMMMMTVMTIEIVIGADETEAGAEADHNLVGGAHVTFWASIAPSTAPKSRVVVVVVARGRSRHMRRASASERLYSILF